jgi:FHA domain-containing protein/IPT/TIG domain-containing protein
MAGTSLVIDDAVDEVLVGSDPDCRLSLDLPGVSPIHARVWRDLGGITVYDTRSPRGLYVNDDRVVDQAPLRDGDILWLGAPGDADSVMLQCRLPEESFLGAPVTDAGYGPPAADELPPMTEEPLPTRSIDFAEEPPPAPEFFQDDSETASAADVASLLDLPSESPRPMDVDDTPAPSAALTPMVTATAPAVDDAPAASGISVAPEDIAIDPAWASDDALQLVETPGPQDAPPPEDLDALLAAEPPPAALPPMATTMAPVVDDAPAPLAAPTPMVTAAAPVVDDPPAPPDAVPPAPMAAPPPMVTATAPVVDDAPAPPAAPTPMVTATAPPVDSAPAPPAVSRQLGGKPPLTAAPRAIIDNTRPHPEPRKVAPSVRPEAPEGVMDWARGIPSADEAPEDEPASPAARAPRPRIRARRGRLLPVVAAVVVLAALAGGYYALTASRMPRIDIVRPARVTTGMTLTLTGTYLGDTTGATSASIGGRPARVVRTTGDLLEIEVPELATTPGRDTSVPVVVIANGRPSNTASVAVFQAPRLKLLTPDVAMPGDDVVLSGISLAPGVNVRFDDIEAQVVDASAESLTVKVPALTATIGTEVPVVASFGADPSNALTLVVGKAPLVSRIEPRSASPGDLVTVTGRGFNSQTQANRVTVGGVPALVLSAGPRTLEFVVPWAIAGEGTITITVPGSTQIGQEEMSISALGEAVGFRFVAEPFEDVPGHDHAALATGLGPAFILTAWQGRSAAERAYEAQKRFNDAAQVLRSTRTAEIHARYDPAPALLLAPRDTVLLDVAEADAGAYGEDWTPSRAKGPVTAARLATWWEAVARDLVLLLLRGEKPQNAQALASEGKVLGDLYEAARRRAPAGVANAMVTEARGPMRDALRAVALRVPAAVGAPVARADSFPAPAPTADSVPPLKLDGSWRGSETESAIRKPITIVFRGGSGTLTYERGLSMSVPVLAVQQPQKGAVRFEVRVGGGTRFYRGRWDGARITGKLTSDPEGRTEIGTFDLDPAG